ncbi:CBS domain-containing protein [Oscillatoria sp. CS-180]|uniref:CBS domain-containing protein n=1 Tax=Oscillatoria sp. CS-180 TaxID=3021720 RepID=UPI00232B9493|nr:CBS domain-containing protein [Oscillatoria sp. CS-180]MDB9527686.1 CBS domain-containing protein [Oscillatoria sp. CS-180]
MQLETSLSWVPDPKEAIARHPLVVSPDTLLIDAIALISKAQYHTCSLNDDITPSDLSPFHKTARNSCVLVMKGKTILGILTERDVVRLTAQALDLKLVKVADVMVSPVITLPESSIQDVFAALFLFRRYGIRHVPVVDDENQLVGVVSHESIRRVLRPANLLRSRRTADVMTRTVICAHLKTPIIQLAQLMAMHRVSCVVITHPNREGIENPVGIVTERDIVQFQALQIDLHKTLARTVMSAPLFLLSPEDSLWVAHQEMQKRRVGRLVVSWNWGQGLGLVTQTSLLKVFDPVEMYGVIENLQQTLQQMQGQQTPSPVSSQKPLSKHSLHQHQGHSSPLPLSAQRSGERTDSSDREQLLSSLDQTYTFIQQIVDSVGLSVSQQKEKLESILHTLEQLHPGIGSVEASRERLS